MKVLFLGFAHEINDPRLYYREIDLIKRESSFQVIWVTNRDSKEMPLIDKLYKIDTSQNKIKKLYMRVSQLIKIVKKEKPLIVQASDIRELPYILILKTIFPKTKIIYDSHEDYVGQIKLFENKKLKAHFYKYLEIFSLKFIDIMFCTDKYLLNYYKRYFSKIYLMRNFPNLSHIERMKKHFESDTLKVVYIGTMNEHKGVLDVIDHVINLNETPEIIKKVELHLYTDLKKETIPINHDNNIIFFHPYENLDILYKSLTKYDIGVCMWRKYDKFERNLPIKNFDYMFVGLPVVTSNFGNLKVYIEKSNSGLCIKPQDYNSFKDAIISLFDHKLRGELGKNGYNFFVNNKGFNGEAKEYLKIFKNFN